MKSIITFSFLIIGWANVGAQIFVKQDAVGTNDGTSWANAFTDLQSALDAAAANSQVWIAAGKYVPQGPTPQESHFWMLEPMKLYGGFEGGESSLSERNLELHHTILTGDKNGDDVVGSFNNRIDNAHHTLIIDAPNGESILDGLIFEGGAARIDAYAPDATDEVLNRWAGGALYVKRSPTTISNCAFRGNQAGRGSGLFAIGNLTNNIELMLINTSFHSNNAIFHGGGAFLTQWSTSNTEHCQFQNNSAVNNGGGLYFSNTNGSVSNCSFQNNHARYGGGFMVFHNAATNLEISTVLLSKTSFIENDAFMTGGGFDFTNFEKGFSLTIDSCFFTRNSTVDSYLGGGINITDRGDIYPDEPPNQVHIHNCEFNENAAFYAGGVFMEGLDDSLNIEISNSKFLSNTAGDVGGGLYLQQWDLASVDLQLKNTLFESNAAVYGGGGLTIDSKENRWRQTYTIDSCLFNSNFAGDIGGAIWSLASTQDPGAIGIIRNSQFYKNDAIACGGAIISFRERLLIENTLFSENHTEGSVYQDNNGGGAILFSDSKDVTIKNTIFDRNISDDEAGAIFLYGGTNAQLENVLFTGNSGKSTILNNDTLFLMNNTLLQNQNGISLKSHSQTSFQNSIFSNNPNNLFTEDSIIVISKGSNISDDNSMINFLTGSGFYDDLNNTDPLLNFDGTLQSNSPAIDAGNPEGVNVIEDIAGNPRVSGGAIDIGSYESFFVAVKDAIWNDPSLNLYPNPVSDILNLKIESSWVGETSINIYNQIGQQIYSALENKTNNTEVFKENVLNLAQGHYFLLVKTGQHTYASTIIIQR